MWKTTKDNVPGFELNWRYNWCAGHHHFDRWKDQAFIIHLAGMKDRLAELQNLLRDRTFDRCNGDLPVSNLC
jgi:hypothetical protein